MTTDIGQKFKVNGEDTLLPFLFRILPSQSRTSVKSMLRHGRIAVDGNPVTAFDYPLSPGAVVTILPKAVPMAMEMEEEAAESLEKAQIRILYEDDSLIVAEKPSGLLTVSAPGAKKGGPTLYSLLNSYVKQNARAKRKIGRLKGEKPDHSVVKIWIIHRLDRETSGLLVFAKDQRTKDIMQSKWKELVQERSYTAFLEGQLAREKGSIQSYLSENPKSLKMRSSEVETPDSKLAISHYRLISTVSVKGKVRWSKVEFRLQTGRKNQIRVHAADMGHPVAGDERYGAVTDPAGRLALHASTLVFRHPHTGRILSFTSPLPQEFNRLEQNTSYHADPQNDNPGIG